MILVCGLLVVSCSSTRAPVTQAPTRHVVAPGRASQSTTTTTTAAAPDAAPSPIPMPPAPTVVFSVSFVSPTQGWAIAQQPCGQAPQSCVSVYETFDRGLHWQERGAPAAGGPNEAGATDNYVSQIRFANALDGYAFNRSLWITRDGGATWTPDPVPGRSSWATDVEAADGVAYLVTAPCGDGAGDCEGPDTVYAAPAGSTSWRAIGHFAFGSQGAQVVVAGHNVYAMLSGPGGDLLAGSEAGLSARPLPSSCRYPGIPVTVAAWAPGGLVLVCGMAVSSNSATPVVSVTLFRSEDNGWDWTLVSRNPPGRPGESLAALSSRVLLMAVPGPGTNGAGLWRSSDGGTTWTGVPGAPASPDYVGFETSSEGVLIGGNGLYLTDDGGLSWIPARGLPG